MKKLFIFLASAAVTLTSCNLDIEPETSLRGEDANTFEYINGMRLGLYSAFKGLTSGAFLYYPDYHTDLFNETYNSGNRGGYFSRWYLSANDQDVESIWGTYYSYITQVNYALDKLHSFIDEKGLELSDDELNQLDVFESEYHFFRAYTIHQLALRFCRDYEPDTADLEPGVPTPSKYDPNQQLSRGTLEDTYQFILDDIEDAKGLENVPGESDSIYLTADALTAFKAQIALQMHDYANASGYAYSLQSKYPLVDNANDLDKMWREDTSTETIFQPEVNSSTSLGTVGSMSDYYNGSWSDQYGMDICQAAYVPTQSVVNAFDDNDIRYGIYVTPSVIYYNGDYIRGGVLMTKFLGNRTFQTSKYIYTYMNMPKVFRVAEMYLIDAEARYKDPSVSDADAVKPLNALRNSRGLESISSTGAALFQEIKEERMREMIGEGTRLTDLKRWGDGITNKDSQSYLLGYVRGDSEFSRAASHYQWVFPIPEEEFSNNKNLTSRDQNPGY